MKSYLIVDDSPTVRMRVKQAIRAAQQDAALFLEAGDADTACGIFGDKPVDAVFLDLVMPEQPDGAIETHAGLGVLRTMLDHRPGTPVVLVSAFPPEHSEVMAAMSFGAFAHLQKPVKPMDVKRVLDALDPAMSVPSSFYQ